uniref:Major facilitator superfamily (MFS) profile domain-containing protein n=1 Tax=Aplanochytrium stocchinoi TaxID=215587 RepID=A0A6S8F4E4_9STRA|mmetsp:Transcript_5962/g.6828  ORF Transcript_5962/g.6828 Transcript_5962/m.6828 type:complete len:344 (+) Transcript_5962:136-1167(+)
MLIGMKRNTTSSNKTFAFGMFYTIMNIGALCCGPIIDGFTLISPISANRFIFALGGFLSSLGGWIAVSYLEEESTSKSKRSDMENGTGKEKDNKNLRNTYMEPSFIRFMVFSLLLTNVRSIFRHLDATLPKYLIRKHGPGVAKGSIYSINPLVIILGVPAVTALTSRIDSYSIILCGSYISALSPCVFAILDNLFGAGLFVFILSIGETLWSPRFLDYQVSVSPEGREAVFMAFASAPLFLSKLPVGWFSGYLLDHYCPDPLKSCETKCMVWIFENTCKNTTDTDMLCKRTCNLCDTESDAFCVDSLCHYCDSSNLWLWVALTTVISPILMQTFRKQLAEPKS